MLIESLFSQTTKPKMKESKLNCAQQKRRLYDKRWKDTFRGLAGVQQGNNR